MVIDVNLNQDSTSIEIPDPFHPDLDDVIGRIDSFVSTRGADTSGLDLKGLISKMIRGIVGCEQGCPANAKGLVSDGFKGFDLQYIEGGILLARTSLNNGSLFGLKMFPEF